MKLNCERAPFTKARMKSVHNNVHQAEIQYVQFMFTQNMNEFTNDRSLNVFRHNTAFDHGSDWNTWFQLFGWVSEYFWEYIVYHQQLWKCACFLQAVFLKNFTGTAPCKSSSIDTLPNADSRFITEYHFHPVIHSPWLLFFSPLSPLFCLGVNDGFHLAFLYINVICFVVHFLFLRHFAFCFLSTLWYLPWSTTMLPFYNLPIFFVLGPDFRHSWLGTTSIFCNIPWWFTFLRNFIILSFVSTDISRVGAMIHVSPLGTTALQVVSALY